MSLTEMFLEEYDTEMEGTRKMLALFPSDKVDWKPHPKSFSMTGLAGHICQLPDFITKTCSLDKFEMKASDYVPYFPKTASDALAKFDAESKIAREALSRVTDPAWKQPWSFIYEGTTYFTMPRAAVHRSFCMNHIIHHRAQLTVYYRMNDIRLPGLYGPTADES